MNWFKVDKSKTPQPTNGNYTKWKPILSKEGKSQCVYCSIRESDFGGIRNYHVEHLKPKSKFPALINKIENLFFSCSICNIFKSDDWFESKDEKLDSIYFPNPSKIDYSVFLKATTSGKIYSEVITGKFIIERLALNRPQLIKLRRRHLLFRKSIFELNRIHDLLSHIFDEDLLDDYELKELMKEANKLIKETNNSKDKLYQALPYTTKDTNRPI